MSGAFYQMSIFFNTTPIGDMGGTWRAGGSPAVASDGDPRPAMKKFIVGISGATGAIYGIRLLEILRGGGRSSLRLTSQSSKSRRWRTACIGRGTSPPRSRRARSGQPEWSLRRAP